jgi:hypothetical protein
MYTVVSTSQLESKQFLFPPQNPGEIFFVFL